MTEFGLIEYVAKLFGDVDRQGWEAIGDDCTVLPIGGGEVIVMTTDMLQEDVHFLRSGTSARTKIVGCEFERCGSYGRTACGCFALSGTPCGAYRRVGEGVCGWLSLSGGGA